MKDDVRIVAKHSEGCTETDLVLGSESEVWCRFYCDNVACHGEVWIRTRKVCEYAATLMREAGGQ